MYDLPNATWTPDQESDIADFLASDAPGTVTTACIVGAAEPAERPEITDEDMAAAIRRAVAAY